MASLTWSSKGAPETVPELRKALIALAKKKSGKALIDKKFTDDHVFAGHAGSVQKLGSMLAKLRELPQSTLFISSLDSNAQKEVVNWIENVPAGNLSFRGGTWTITAHSVTAESAYKFATVDLDQLKAMNKDDIVKKSRKWLTESQKTPKISCRFASSTDGTIVIYHMDY